MLVRINSAGLGSGVRAFEMLLIAIRLCGDIGVIGRNSLFERWWRKMLDRLVSAPEIKMREPAVATNRLLA